MTVVQRLVVSQESLFDDLLEVMEEEDEMFFLKLPLMNRP